MKEIIKYEHHKRLMSVIKKNKGNHAKNCLCWQKCKYFIPDDRDKNCEIASTLFEINCKYGITTAVWECEKYETKL